MLEQQSDGLAARILDGLSREGHFQPEDLPGSHVEHAKHQAFGEVALADAYCMLYARRVVGYARLVGDGHGIGGAHPAHHEVRCQVAVGVGVAGESDVDGAGFVQLGHRQLDVFGRPHLVGDALDVA